MTCEIKHQINPPLHHFWMNQAQKELGVTESNIPSKIALGEISPSTLQAQQMITKLLYSNKISFKDYALLKRNLSDQSFFLHYITSNIDQLVGDSSCAHEIKSKIQSFIELSEQYPQDLPDHSLSILNIGKLIYASSLDTQVNITTFSDDELEEHVKEQETILAKSFLKVELQKTLGIENINLLLQINHLIDTNKNKELKEVILKHLSASMQEDNLSISGFQIEDYHHSFSNICADDFLRTLYFQLKAQKLVQAFAVNVVDLTHGINSVSIDTLDKKEQYRYLDCCKKGAIASRVIFDSFKDLPLPSATAYSGLYGRVQTAWKTNVGLFAQARHAFCDCHISENIHHLWPQEKVPFLRSTPSALDPVPDRTAVIFSCSYGSGHKQATASTFDVMKKMGYHAYSIDVPDDVLKEEANLFSRYEHALGPYCPKLTCGDIFNTLMQKKAYSLINFLSGNDPHAGKMRTLAPIAPLHVKKIVNRLLINNPQLVVVNYLPDIRNIIEAAKILNLPVIHTHTDISPFELTWRIPPQPYEKFYELLPYDGYQNMLVPSHLKPEQVRITGPVCNSIFDSPCLLREVEQKRKELGIDSDKKVIIISNGMNGVATTPPFLHFLKTRYRNTAKTQIPFHIVVLCGRNNSAAAEDLQSKFSKFLPITALSSLPTDEMKTLMGLASQGGLMVGKPGGLSVVESQKMHLPMIFDCIPPSTFSWSLLDTPIGLLNRLATYLGHSKLLPWEQDNKDFAVDHNLGQVCDSEEKFNSILDGFENKNFSYTPYPPSVNFSEEFSKIIKEVS